MITPIQTEQDDMGLVGNTFSMMNGVKKLKKVTSDENKLLRLAFHDCIPYEDGTGGQSCQINVPSNLIKQILRVQKSN